VTIGTVANWIGDRSVWWLLALPPIIWILRGLRDKLTHVLWCRNRRKQIECLAREEAACVKLSDFDGAAWCAWQRIELKELLDHAEMWPWPGFYEDGINGFQRRQQALMDAYSLAKDQAFMETQKATLAEEAVGETRGAPS
jgi:hypothetical protein